MTLQELAEKVVAMRRAQRSYCRTPSLENLVTAKELERHVDAVLREVLDPQPNLFDPPPAKAAHRARGTTP
jgi:hypothetical protein